MTLADSNGFKSASKVGAFHGGVKGLSNGEYHSLKDYYSSTDLKTIYATTPQHWRHKKEVGAKKTTDAMALGSLVHCLLLTPSEVVNDFFIMPELNLRTNDGRAERDRLVLEHSTKILVTQEQINKANDIVVSAMRNPKIVELLEPGLKEAAFFWECPFSYLNFKAKLDSYVEGEYMIELKTTSSAKPEAFSRHAYNMNYDLSACHYLEGLRAFHGGDLKKAYFIVLETEPPYVSQVYLASDSFLESGHTKWVSSVEKLEQAIKKDSWSGYSSPGEILELNAPAWAQTKVKEEDEIWEEIT